MRVIQLGPYPPPHGGVQSNLVAIHRLLLKRGESSRVINITRHRKVEGDGVYYPMNWRELSWLLVRLPYDIVHLHIGGGITSRLLALSFLCCAIPGRKSVLTFHSGGYPSSDEGARARPRSVRGFIFRRFDRVIAVNPEIVRLFGRWGLRPERVRLIPPHALPEALPDRALPERLSTFFAGHGPVLLTVGLLEPEYDLRAQIEVLGRVRRRHPKAGLVIIGSGSLDSDLRDGIAAAPHAADVLLCGDLPHEDTLLAMSRCSLFLRTSLYDGDSIAVREAIHLGAPVVATDTGMRPSGVRLVPISDVDALEKTIEEILARPGARRASDGPSEDNIEAVLALYGELMGEPG